MQPGLIPCLRWPHAKMLIRDILRFTTQSVVSNRMRSSLTALSIGIGVTTVVLLTSIGEGVNQYIVEQFTQFGTTVLAVQPGKANTLGISAGVLNSVRPLSLQDAIALKRAPYVQYSVPVVSGIAPVENGGRQRTVNAIAVGPDFNLAFKFELATGSFLAEDELDRPRAVAVLGSTLRQELFSSETPIGKRIRVGGERYRIVGVMKPKGEMLGIDLDDSVYIPAARGLELFNREGLHEIDVVYQDGAPTAEVIAGVTRIMMARHGGEDFTITSQQQMLDTLGSIIGVLIFAVAALGGISLLVGGVGIFTIMTIAVRERTHEIGLLRAIGAPKYRITQLFLGEAMVLAGLGGAGGLLLAITIVVITTWIMPNFPAQIPLLYASLSEITAVTIGVAAGLMPARRAASLVPLEALRAG